MERQIKFRGKRIDNGEWVYGNYNKEYDGTVQICFWVSECIEPENDYWEPVHKGFQVDPATVGQLVRSLTRSAGKEIYEGDYISYSLAEGLGEPQVNGLKSTVTSIEDNHFWFIHVKLLDNIHDNPELLKH